MELKKAIKKVIALGAGATMVGATIMGAMAADLGSLPSPFIKDGAFDGLIVVGDDAAASDVIGAVDIATSLQFSAKTETTLGCGTAAGTVTVEGDAVQIKRGSDILELRENLGSVRETLTETELDGLAGGMISTSEGVTDYNQYFNVSNGMVVYEENEDDEVGDFLKYEDGESIYEWHIEFESGLESEIEAGELPDIEDKNFNLLGQTMSIVKTSITGREMEIEFMGGDLTDTLEEGESRTYTIGDKDYEVEVIIVSDNKDASEGTAMFKINGEVTDELRDGETYVLKDRTEIGIRNILPNEAGDVTGDLVEFYLGANKITFKDTNFADDIGEQHVEVGRENIEDGRVMIKASNTSEVATISSIKYTLLADAQSGNVYVPAGHGVKEYLDEGEGMLNPEWDIEYHGLSDTGVSTIKFDPSGDDAYYLAFTTVEGLDYRIPYMDNSRDDVNHNFWKWGKDEENLWFVEGCWNADLNVTCAMSPLVNASVFPIEEEDYFVLTDNPDENSFTHVLTYDSFDASERKLTFSDLAGGSKEVIYEAVAGKTYIGTADLIVGGKTYKVYVQNNVTAGYNATLAIDLNGDGVVNFSMVPVTVKGGGLLYLGQAANITGAAGVGSVLSNPTEFLENRILNATTGTQPEDFNASLKTLKSEFDEDGYLNTGNDELVYIELHGDHTNKEVTLDVDGQPQQLYMNSLEDDEDIKRGMTLYGALFEHMDEDDDADSLLIEYPLEQREALVFVTTGDTTATKSSGADGDLTVTEVTKIEVGAAQLASAVAGEEKNHNLILVGGPCANAAARAVTGVTMDMCAEGFTEGKAKVKMYDDTMGMASGKVALLVAGYSAEDTRRAAKVVANYDEYELSGMEVEVSGTSMTDISVGAPTVVEEAEEVVEDDMTE